MSEAAALARSSAELVAAARAYRRAARAPNTLRAYKGDWQRFEAFCSERGVESLPASPATVATYLTHLALGGRSYATIARALATISQAHKMSSLPSPRASADVGEVLKGIARTHGSAAKRRKVALSVDELRTMSEALPYGLAGLRDRAMLVVGFAGAMRRAELVALDVSDLEVSKEGVAVTIRRSKTDAEGRGNTVYMPYGSNPSTCPVRTLQAWLEAAQITEGPVFVGCRVRARRGARLTGQAVARVLKRACTRAEMPTAAVAGHSLRRGFITAAARAGKRPKDIMRQSRHETLAALQVYIAEAEGYQDNAASGIGL